MQMPAPTLNDETTAHVNAKLIEAFGQAHKIPTVTSVTLMGGEIGNLEPCIFAIPMQDYFLKLENMLKEMQISVERRKSGNDMGMQLSGNVHSRELTKTLLQEVARKTKGLA